MTFTYPAVFTKHEDNSYSVYFPDLEMCTAEGRTYEEASDNARDQERNWIELELDETGELPASTLPEDIHLEEGSEVHMMMCKIKFLPDSE